jgi:hypothetical protein
MGALLCAAVPAGDAAAAVAAGEQILYGNLAPEGCVGKITGKEGLVFEGPARVFDCEEDMLAALSENPESMKARAQRLAAGFLLPTLKSAAMGPV